MFFNMFQFQSLQVPLRNSSTDTHGHVFLSQKEPKSLTNYLFISVLQWYVQFHAIKPSKISVFDFYKRLIQYFLHNYMFYSLCFLREQNVTWPPDYNVTWISRWFSKTVFQFLKLFQNMKMFSGKNGLENSKCVDFEAVGQYNWNLKPKRYF